MATCLWLVGCGPEPGLPMAADAPPAPDAPAAPGEPGVHLTWQQVGTLRSDRRLTESRLRIKVLRLLGDVSSDSRTIRERFDVRWDASHAPDPIAFDQAPPGMYAALDVRMDGESGEAFELRGQVNVNGTWRKFRIEDEGVHRLELPLNKSVEPGQGLALTLEVNLAALVNAANFANAEYDDGEYEVENSVDVRQALKSAFVLRLP